jgi:hypothetical protein
MMDLTGSVLRDAARFVDDCAGEAELHTVKMEIDGASGGVILTVLGSIEHPAGMSTGFERTYIVGTTRDGEVVSTTQ